MRSVSCGHTNGTSRRWLKSNCSLRNTGTLRPCFVIKLMDTKNGSPTGVGDRISLLSTYVSTSAGATVVIKDTGKPCSSHCRFGVCQRQLSCPCACVVSCRTWS
jgi:hypothetical protein